MLKEYNEIKEEIKNPETSVEVYIDMVDIRGKRMKEMV